MLVTLCVVLAGCGGEDSQASRDLEQVNQDIEDLESEIQTVRNENETLKKNIEAKEDELDELHSQSADEEDNEE